LLRISSQSIRKVFLADLRMRWRAIRCFTARMARYLFIGMAAGVLQCRMPGDEAEPAVRPRLIRGGV